jgi:WD40 repeat protein
MQTGRAKAITSGRSEILNLTLSSDGRRLACDCRTRAAEVLDAKTGALRLSAPHSDYVWAVALSPDSNWLAVAGGSHGLPVELWNVQSGQLAHKLVGVNNAGAVAFSPDSKVLAVASQEDEKIELFKTQTGESWQTFSKDNSRFSHLVFSPDGRLLAAIPDLAGWVYIYDLREKRWTGALHTEGTIRNIAFSVDSKMLATAGYDDKTVRIWSNPSSEN